MTTESEDRTHHNHITGNEIRFTDRPTDPTTGRLGFEVTVAPGFGGRLFELDRRSPRQRQHLAVTKGALQFTLDDQFPVPDPYDRFSEASKGDATSGESVFLIPAGEQLDVAPIPHRFRNGREDAQTRVSVRLTPPLDTFEFIMRGYAIARERAGGTAVVSDGRTDSAVETTDAEGTAGSNPDQSTDPNSAHETFDAEQHPSRSAGRAPGFDRSEGPREGNQSDITEVRSFGESFSELRADENGRRALRTGMALMALNAFILPLVVVNAYIVRLARAGMGGGEVPAFEPFGKLLDAEKRAEWKPYLLDGVKITILVYLVMFGPAFSLIPGGQLLLGMGQSSVLGALVVLSAAFFLVTVYVMAIAHRMSFMQYIRVYTLFPVALHRIYLTGFARSLAVWLPLFVLNFWLATVFGFLGTVVSGIVFFPAYAAIYYHLGECWAAAEAAAVANRQSQVPDPAFGYPPGQSRRL